MARALPIRVGDLAIVAFAMTLAYDATALEIGLSIDSHVSITDPPQLQIFQINLDPGPQIVDTLSVGGAGGDSASLFATLGFGSIDSMLQATSVFSRTTSSFFGIWEDTFNATSNTLPVGTPVQYLFTALYDISTTCSGGANVQTTVGFSDGLQAFFPVSTDCNATFQGMIQFVQATTIGTTLQMEGQINQFAAANLIGDSVLIDPSVGFFIDPITAGASYTTGSGTSYLSPTTSVPEPATLALFAVGLAGLGLARRGRRSNLSS